MDKQLQDLLWKAYAEQATHARHHEEQRSRVSTLLVAIAGGLLAIISFDKQLLIVDLPIALLLTLLGFFGAVFSLKQYERFVLHWDRAYIYFDKLAEVYPELKATEEREELKAKRLKRFPLVTRVRSAMLWMMLHLFIGVVGITLTVVVLFF